MRIDVRIEPCSFLGWKVKVMPIGYYVDYRGWAFSKAGAQRLASRKVRGFKNRRQRDIERKQSVIRYSEEMEDW